MSIRRKIVNVLMRTLTGMFASSQPGGQDNNMDKQAVASETTAFNAEPAVISEEQAMGMPFKRRVIQSPVLVAEVVSQSQDEILIKAQPTIKGDQCVFMVNRPLFAGHSWWFPTFESAEGSPLAEALFTLDGVENVLVDNSTLTITRSSSLVEWLPLAQKVGATIRGLLQADSPLMAYRIVKAMPAEETIRADIQRVIDSEVNPGVAGHGGRISLISVKGNTVTVQMGGGCQGCSAADVTLKVGIHNSFRKAVPSVGAIYDETDHGAGSNPYFS